MPVTEMMLIADLARRPDINLVLREATPEQRGRLLTQPDQPLHKIDKT
jgi:hypothetical protein